MGKIKTWTAGGETLTAAEWAKRFRCKPETFRARISQRMKRGMSLEEAILTPPMDFEQVAKLGRAATPWHRTNKRMYRSNYR